MSNTLKRTAWENEHYGHDPRSAAKAVFGRRSQFDKSMSKIRFRKQLVLIAEEDLTPLGVVTKGKPLDVDAILTRDVFSKALR